MREMSREHQEESERREEDLMSRIIVALFVARVHLAELNMFIYIFFCLTIKNICLHTQLQYTYLDNRNGEKW